MNAWRIFTSLNRSQRNAFLASFLGWTLDAFDYFLLTFVVIQVSHDLGVSPPAISFTLTLTLMLRPVGALIFGLLAERFGRRLPLMIDIVFYSFLELLTAFSPSYTFFFILRILFGIAMGGEWGIGASLAMESLPKEARGLFSGILQQGYAVGYLLGALVFALVYNVFPAPFNTWRVMFAIGALPALVVVFIRLGVKESPVWEHQQMVHRERGVSVWQGMITAVARRPWLFLYLIILMTAFNCLSHGTQDMYPTFLQGQWKYNVTQTTILTAIANCGAIIGGTLFGHYSQFWGRRRAILVSCIIGVIMIPLWSGLLMIPGLNPLISLPIGAFLLQFMVQGAWGVVPVHLNELSPTDVRGTFPGFAYQLGNLFASWIVFIETLMAYDYFGTAKNPNFTMALSIFSLGAFLAVIILAAIGREAHGVDFIETGERDGTQLSPETAPGD
ncbi:SHS family lactate transporter-like MFS transporter [Thermosporothrix hazakensis]|jgi:SHS family lactate transporter-like MFS transporter|uniref:SHS family lactate transporter-like MFS transporter n=2 Tax=Thermosporothrix TaxID=768650 RepID=A0A326U5N6_THEHA|nr:MFS transporter [Thermosporothrix hazakensis]PZW27920.1 SHS family lactate transporter-like MFS transporter [Thermosporothrix hazakensis]BBH86849.1 MFS transporter [Thermosporothrix sp. COM3]GCE51145.1 MFS transporter [Thermosporothrix hazakensis]